MNKNLLIVGAGQYGLIAKEIAEDMGCFEKIDFLDEINEIAIGKLDDYECITAYYPYAVAAFENPDTRLQWIKKLEKSCFRIAILAHPNARISPKATVMPGCIIEPMAVIQSDCVIATGCIISADAVIKSVSMCCEGVHVDSNATVLENTLVPARLHICSNTAYKNESIDVTDLFINTEIQYPPKTGEKTNKDKQHGPLPVDGIEYCFEDGI